MIKPWIFEFVEPFQEIGVDMPPEYYAGVYEWFFDLWPRLEDIGFEGIFFSEHHFVHGRLMPSPHLLISAVAMRTKTLRLGVMGSVLPLHEPWRLAEEVGMLDLITQGRYELGLSSGAHPKETDKIGMLPEEVRPRFNEGIDIVEKALTGKPFSHEGTFWKLDNLTTSPQPLQKPMPPRWMTGISEGSAENAARRGHKFCIGFLDVERVKQVFDAFNAAAKEAGMPSGPERLALRRQIFVADSEAEAADIADAAAAQVAANAGRNFEGKIAAPPKKAESSLANVPDAPKSSDNKSLFNGKDETIMGSPKQVAEKIVEQCRAVGAGHVLGYVFQGATREQVGRNYELWRQVIPVLRKAEVA